MDRSWRIQLSDEDFHRLSSFIHTECGIKMPPAKRVMLEARLRKRLRMLGMNSFAEYCDYVFSPEGEDGELVNMIDVVTTNKTEFFREPKHFDYLASTVLPELHALGRKEPYRFWSTACSTGEEPYTLAMVLSEFAAAHEGFRFEILATDLSTEVLRKGIAAVYREESISTVSETMRKKYLLRSRDREKKQVRISAALRSKVSFMRLNLMSEDYGIEGRFDVLFCRNVMIYFDKPTQEIIVNRLSAYMDPHSYLFMGHSETLMGLRAPLGMVASTVYQLRPGG